MHNRFYNSPKRFVSKQMREVPVKPKCLGIKRIWWFDSSESHYFKHTKVSRSYLQTFWSSSGHYQPVLRDRGYEESLADAALKKVHHGSGQLPLSLRSLFLGEVTESMVAKYLQNFLGDTLAFDLFQSSFHPSYRMETALITHWWSQ